VGPVRFFEQHVAAYWLADLLVRGIPPIRRPLAEDGKLDAVDGEEFVEGETEGHGGEDVNLDWGPRRA